MMTNKATGVHHLAIATGDLRAQLDFFSQTLGMELVALYPMHGVEGVIHAFVKASDTCYIAFAYHPDIANIPVEFGKTHAGYGANNCAPGAMQHLAFDVPSEEALYAMRDRIRLNGVNVIGPMDHGMCKSIYFAGPEHLTLEVAYSEAPIDHSVWVDPELAATVGIAPRTSPVSRHPPTCVPIARFRSRRSTPRSRICTFPRTAMRRCLRSRTMTSWPNSARRHRRFNPQSSDRRCP